jgi:flagellin FlaB
MAWQNKEKQKRRRSVNKRVIAALRRFHSRQEGMSGLTTAIILIAFVTVASVLAYSVLSAGIFSSEKAKETVYKGLTKSSNTLEATSYVLGLSPNQTRLESVQFFLGLTIPTEKVDTNAIVINYWDDETHYQGCDRTITLANGSLERGTSYVMEADEQFRVNVTIPASANVTAYQNFTVEVLPPTGGAVKIKRYLPGTIIQVMDLY